MKPVVRTSLGLREALFDELDGLRAGTSNPQKSSAIVKAANAIISSVKMELEYSRFMKSSEGEALPTGTIRPIQLG